MKSKPGLLNIIVLLILSLITIQTNAFAFWVWTPESNKWVNPKYAVKETPAEQLEFAYGYFEKNQYKEALREFRKLIKHYPRAREAPEAQFFIAQIYDRQGNIGEAFRQYQEVIEKYPFSERSTDIIYRQYELGVEALEGGNRNAFMDTLTGNDMEMLEIFRTVIKNDPYGKFAAPSQYKIALYLSEKRLYQEARDEYEKVINDYPQTEYAQAAQYQIAMLDSKRSADAAYDQKITEVALTELENFARNFPDADLSVQAKEEIRLLRDKEARSKFEIAQFYEKQKNYAAAKIYYKKILDEYKDSPWTVKALKRIRDLTGKTE